MFPLRKVGCRGHWGRTSESVMWSSPKRFVEALVCRESGLVLPSLGCACSQHSFQKYTFVPWQSSGCEVKLLSRVWLSAIPWTLAYQAPLSMEFSRQEYWSGLPFPFPSGCGRVEKTRSEIWVLSLALPPVASRILFKCLTFCYSLSSPAKVYF